MIPISTSKSSCRIRIGFVFVLAALLMKFFVVFNAHAQDQLISQDRAKFGKAQSLNNIEKYGESLELLKELHAAYREHKNISVELAKAFGYSRHLEEAVALLDPLKEQFPQDKEVALLYASILEANGEAVKAKEEYLNILKTDPENYKLFLKIADLAHWSGDYETAVIYYRKLLTLHIQDNDIPLKLADVLRYMGKYEEALELYEQYIANNN
jgi:thioredoxin-like negative regulator of GroEL